MLIDNLSDTELYNLTPGIVRMFTSESKDKDVKELDEALQEIQRLGVFYFKSLIYWEEIPNLVNKAVEKVDIPRELKYSEHNPLYLLRAMAYDILLIETIAYIGDDEMFDIISHTQEASHLTPKYLELCDKANTNSEEAYVLLQKLKETEFNLRLQEKSVLDKVREY